MLPASEREIREFLDGFSDCINCDKLYECDKIRELYGVFDDPDDDWNAIDDLCSNCLNWKEEE